MLPKQLKAGVFSPKNPGRKGASRQIAGDPHSGGRTLQKPIKWNPGGALFRSAARVFRFSLPDPLRQGDITPKPALADSGKAFRKGLRGLKPRSDDPLSVDIDITVKVIHAGHRQTLGKALQIIEAG